MSKVDRISTLQYMGSKSRILESICMPIIDNKDISRVVDLFAGTGSVGYALSPYKSIVSNDLDLSFRIFQSGKGAVDEQGKIIRER